MTSPSAGSSTTTARLTTLPTPRMPTWGRLMIGVSNSAPRLPVVGQRERAACQLVGADVAGAGAGGEVGDLPGKAADVQVARAVDDRDHQATVGVHRDAEVLGGVVGDLLSLGVDDRVELRVHLERLDGGLREETAGNVSLTPSRASNADFARSLSLAMLVTFDLDHGGQLRGGLQRLDHPLGDDLARPGHPLGGAAQRGRDDLLVGRRGSGGRRGRRGRRRCRCRRGRLGSGGRRLGRRRPLLGGTWARGGVKDVPACGHVRRPRCR